jgi:plastocyanin
LPAGRLGTTQEEQLGKHARPLAAAALAVAVLAPATAAQAATKTVDYGLAKTPKGAPESAAFFDFFPAKVKIRAGDKVRYNNNAGLAAIYSGPVREIPPFVTADASAPVAGELDAAGQPFWFNGQPSPFINGALLQPAGDGSVDRRQKQVDHSALGLGEGPPEPYTLTFKKPGTYKVRDAVHPDVVNTVVVVKKGKRVPGRAADRAAVARQVAKRVSEAKRRAAVTPAANTVLAGNDTRNVALLQFFPGDLTVKAGTTVTIGAGKRATDIHDLAIGPEAFMRQTSQGLIRGPGAGGLAISPTVLYPSQPPTAPAIFGGTENGGFVNTGLLDTDDASPLPGTAQITFTTPGTYSYICLIHSDGVNGMGGTITVD